MTAALVEIADLRRSFGGKRRLFGGATLAIHAVQGVDLEIARGETLGIVGESGCGKSTLARIVVGLDAPSGGRVSFGGTPVPELAARDARALARQVQYVFQDPLSSLNPRKTIGAILEAPLRHLLRLGAAQRRERLAELMEAVGLRPEFLNRYPHEFSGGQAQRIGIARALAAEPALIVLDEPVSALDVSIQAQVLNLLQELKRRFDLTYLFISHDLAVVEAVCDRVAVMYFGRVVEVATAAEIFARPRHPYTRLLADTAPVPGRRGAAPEERPAELPNPLDPPPGCAFAPRCVRASETCQRQRPALSSGPAQPAAPASAGPAPAGSAHAVACHHPLAPRES